MGKENKEQEKLAYFGERIDQPKEDQLRQAALDGNLDKVKRLIQDHVDINAKNKEDGFSPLHCAVQGGHLKVVKYLVANGAKVNIADDDGDTPLHIAACNGRKNIISVLIKAGANPLKTNNDEQSAYDVAKEYGDQKTVDAMEHFFKLPTKKTDHRFPISFFMRQSNQSNFSSGCEY